MTDGDTESALNAILMDEDFHALESHFYDATILDILGVADRERQHQAVLAWLLSPRANHGLGSGPLASFIRMVQRRGATGGWTPVAVDEVDLDLAEVETEQHVSGYLDDRAWTGRLDVCVSVPTDDADSSVLLVIEVKVDSEQGADQTRKYASWANGEAISVHDGKERTPLLVYLAPSESKLPLADGFVFVPFTDLASWLDPLRDAAELDRTKLLVSDWQSVLAARPEVEHAGQSALAATLIDRHRESLSMLRQASGKTLATIQRHRRAFDALGVSLRKHSRRSKGDSAFVIGLRERLQSVLPAENWNFGAGRGSLKPSYLPFAKRVQEFFGSQSQGLTLVLWCERPRGGSTLLAVEFYGRPAEVPEEQAKGIRAAFTAHLRPLLESVPGATTSTGQNRPIRLKLHVPQVQGTSDDTDDKLDSFAGEYDRAEEFARSVNAVLHVWVRDCVDALADIES